MRDKEITGDGECEDSARNLCPDSPRTINAIPAQARGARFGSKVDKHCHRTKLERANAALERLPHATTNKGYSPASPLQALVRLAVIHFLLRIPPTAAGGWLRFYLDTYSCYVSSRA